MKQILIHTWQILTKSERRRFLTMTVMDLFITIADIVFLGGLLWIVQQYVHPAAATRLAFLPGNLQDPASPAFVGCFVVLFALKTILALRIVRNNFRLYSDIAIRLSEHNLAAFQSSSYNNYVQTDAATHIRNICFQPFEFAQHLLTGMRQLVSQALLILFSLVAIIVFDARIFLLLLAMLLPPTVILFYFLRRRQLQARRDIQVHNERSYQHLLDALKGYIESNIYGKNEFFRKRFIRHRQQFSQALFNLLTMQEMPARLLELTAVTGLFALVMVAATGGNDGSRSLLNIGVFMAAAYKVIPGLVKMINGIGQVKTYAGSLADMEPIQSKAFQNLNPSQEFSPPIETIRLTDVCFSYGNNAVVRNLSATFNRGDIIGIAGRSGKGKTTLLNIILGFLEPQDGVVSINEAPVNARQIQQHWPQMAYVRQDGFLFHDTVQSNVTLSFDEPDLTMLQMAAGHTGLENLSEQPADVLSRVVAENGRNISGGQQQRIAIARAFYRNADLIIFDEALNELDRDAEARILRHLQTLASSGKIVLLVSHHESALSECTKILTLDDKE